MAIIQVLIIIGVIVFAVVKQLLKKDEEAPKKQPQPYVPEDYYTKYNEPEQVTKARDPFLSYDDLHPTHDQPTLKQHSSPPIQEEPEADQEFNIHSTEEVRRGILWSEILNRKY